MQSVLITSITIFLSPAFALKTSSGVPPPRHELPDVVIQKAAEKGMLEGTGVPMHEVPAAAARASSWEAKIPDIDVNLALAQQWMSVKTGANASATSSSLASGGAVSGVVSMAAAVQDLPKHELYYDCGLVMNTAWGAMARDPCSMKTWTSSEKMKEMVPECSELRYGDKYTDSYQALLSDQDTWCGGPICKPECLPAQGKCIRAAFYPFEAQCERELKVVKLEKKKADSIFDEGNRASVQLGLAVVMSILFFALSFVPFKRS